MGCQAGVETANLITVMKNYKITPTENYESIKLGIDAHAKWYYVARQLDGATPQPVQKMDIDGLLHFVAKQQRLAREVHTCYEAGAFGYYLHRKLEAPGWVVERLEVFIKLIGPVEAEERKLTEAI